MKVSKNKKGNLKIVLKPNEASSLFFDLPDASTQGPVPRMESRRDSGDADRKNLFALEQAIGSVIDT